MAKLGRIAPRDRGVVSRRHSGMVRRTRPGISRFRVRCFASPRNDGGRLFENLPRLVITRESGGPSIPETPMFNPRGRDVLDAPPSRGMTTSVEQRHDPISVVVPANAGTHNHREWGYAKFVDESAVALAKAEQRLSQQAARRMGPRFRGDDVERIADDEETTSPHSPPSPAFAPAPTNRWRGESVAAGP
jgi:hypothetical protein